MAVDGQEWTVSLEYYSWMATQLKGVGERGTTDQLAIDDGTTVRDLLARLSDDSPKFAELVYDREDDRLKEYAALILNGQTIELAGGLDRRLEAGDQLLLLPGFSGGAGRSREQRVPSRTWRLPSSR
jgi:molybdopterin converting factor small subunit